MDFRAFGAPRKPELTGRTIVTFDEDRIEEGLAALAGLDIETQAYAASSDDFNRAPSQVFEELGIVVLGGERDQAQAAAGVLSTFGSREPELVYEVGGASADYLRGYRDGVGDAVDRALGVVEAAPAGRGRAQALGADEWLDDETSTWGRQAIAVHGCMKATGKGIKVAVLDTGLDFEHPDFKGRTIEKGWFVGGLTSAQDGHGHGTHCCGTVCGPAKGPGGAPAYGVAPQVDLLVGKVLADNGRGSTSGILAGMSWALARGAQVISMSLGSPVFGAQQGYSFAYERLARRALEQGCLIVAAAGNDSYRNFGNIAAVSSPANCPSILAVAAIDRHARIAYFSNGGRYGDGGEVNVAGPGVDVLSSWPLPVTFKSISGTSMATPHVAGVAALFAESTGRRGKSLWDAIEKSCVGVGGLSARDVGNGLVQVP